jgi:hypothetical protein
MAINDSTTVRKAAPRLRLNGSKALMNTRLVLFVALMVMAASLAGYYLALFTAPAPATLPVQLIANLFIDINGDGLPDYIKAAEVILNPGVPLP